MDIFRRLRQRQQSVRELEQRYDIKYTDVSAEQVGGQTYTREDIRKVEQAVRARHRRRRR